VGKLQPWSSAKDIILEVLRRLSVKGGVGYIVEYTGPGVETLSVPERATITNMGAELGATTSIFPSDEVTLAFMKAQQRESDYKPLAADPDAVYDKTIEIDLSELRPLVACPHSPDNVKEVAEVTDLKVDQVHIGSCTNSSLSDMHKVADILRGRTIAEDVSLVIAPGSKQVLNMLAADGSLADMIAAGARILESGCGPCIGMGQSPPTDGVSLRTINRNFYGRSGTKSAQVYLVSPEVAAVSAISGYLTDPQTTDIEAPQTVVPEEFMINDNLVVMPADDPDSVEVVRGPNIKPFPTNQPLPEKVAGKSLIKVEDNITTDHIMPSDSKLLPYRSNVPHLANYCLTPCDPDFPARAKEYNGGFIVAGHNYGQGSSREHAALAPLQLGGKGVLAKSFARIHMANLINNGILPLVFVDENDYDKIDLLDDLVITDAPEQVKKVATGEPIVVYNKTKDESYKMNLVVSDREIDMLLEGGLLNLTRKQK
ncbi:MAG TPA: aconitate hydratase, partial [Clostridiaceae bacterium]|nr:aconitate hydratase [Clostridiaceae bacterium]